MADKNIQITVRNPANTDWDELYPVTKAENIIGLENLTTTEKTNLVGAINEVDGDLETHKAETMPHRFTDTDSKVYKYGFKLNTNKDGLVYVYEEVI